VQLEELREEIDVYWSARDYPRVAAILDRAHDLTAVTPDMESRAKIADVIRSYVTPERLNLLMLDFIGGALPVDVAARFWDMTPDDVVWPILLDTWSRLPDGETRMTVLAALRRRAAANEELLQQSIRSREQHRAQAATALRDVLWTR
jgi:hypothetical protein